MRDVTDRVPPVPPATQSRQRSRLSFLSVVAATAGVVGVLTACGSAPATTTSIASHHGDGRHPHRDGCGDGAASKDASAATASPAATTPPTARAAAVQAAAAPASCASGTCWVGVSVATAWVKPWYPRAIDQPALGNPAHPGTWIQGMTVAQKGWLVGRLETQALYGTRGRRHRALAQLDACGHPQSAN